MWTRARSASSPPTRLGPRRDKGFSLIEVLIAVLVLGVGMLGVAALQMNALKKNQNSLQRTQAIAMISFMLDAMRANRLDVENGNYNLPKTCNLNDLPKDDNLVSNDQKAWIAGLKDRIGDAGTTCGEIDCPKGAPACTVRVYWTDSRLASGAEEQFEITTRL